MVFSRLVSLFLGIIVAWPASAAIVESHKIETNRFFVQVTIGLGVESNLATTIVIPGNFWSTPLAITQANRGSYELTDFLTLNGKVQHVVPFLPGDPPQGPLFQYAHTYQSRVGINGVQTQIYFGVGPHGSGGDGAFSVTVADLNPLDIKFWSNFQLGIHIAEGETTFGLICEFIGQAPSLLEGGVSAYVHKNGRTVYVAGSKKGRRSNDVQRCQIVAGTPQNPGPVIANFNGATDWVDAGDIGTVLASSDLVDPGLMPFLESGNCFFDVEFGPFPLETIQVPLRLVGPLEEYPVHHYSIVEGLQIGGDAGSLLSSDDDRVIIQLDEMSPNAELVSLSNVILAPSPQLVAHVESSATRTDILEILEVNRAFTSDWDQMASRLTTLQDTSYDASVVAGSFTYSTPATGSTRARIRWIPTQDISDVDGWSVSVDRISFSAGPIP